MADADPGARAGSMALIWLRLGELAKARTEIASRPSADDQLGRIIAAVSRGQDLDNWADVSPLIWECLDLELGDAAARLLTSFLRYRDGDFGAHLACVLEASVATFRLSAPKAAEVLLSSMEGLFVHHGLGSIYRATLDVLEGRGQPELLEYGSHDELSLALMTCLGEACAAMRIWPAAILALTPTRKRRDLTSENLTELARCIGNDVLS
jgi:hypothetical protein